MTDERRRHDERLADDDVGARARLLAARLRTGGLALERVRLAAQLGDPVARAVLGRDAPPEHATLWAEAISGLRQPECAVGALAAVRLTLPVRERDPVPWPPAAIEGLSAWLRGERAPPPPPARPDAARSGAVLQACGCCGAIGAPIDYADIALGLTLTIPGSTIDGARSALRQVTEFAATALHHHAWRVAPPGARLGHRALRARLDEAKQDMAQRLRPLRRAVARSVSRHATPDEGAVAALSAATAAEQRRVGELEAQVAAVAAQVPPALAEPSAASRHVEGAVRRDVAAWLLGPR